MGKSHEFHLISFNGYSIKGALHFPHLVLEVIAIFFYVGLEIGIPMHLNFMLPIWAQ